MTTLNKPRITQLLALDWERTQGEWKLDAADFVISRRGRYICATHGEGKSFAKEHADAAFIASAPELAEQLRLAVERIEELENMVIAAYNCGWDNGNAAQVRNP